MTKWKRVVDSWKCSVILIAAISGCLFFLPEMRSIRQLMAECRTLHGCETGQAKVTKAYDLSCRWIIHTVGPVWSGGRHQEADLLASCYRQSLRLARQLQKEHRLSSLTIVFPCISTGIYHFPKALACSIAVDTVRDTLSELQAEREIDVIFCCYESEDAQLYKRQLDNKGD